VQQAETVPPMSSIAFHLALQNVTNEIVRPKIEGPIETMLELVEVHVKTVEVDAEPPDVTTNAGNTLVT